MRYSVIIPVYNRPDEADELLQSLTRQSFKDFEVIIVEDGSSIPCKDVAERYQNILDIRYYAKPNSGPGQTRNYGAERSRGEYLIILDSDCILPEGYFAAVEEELQKAPADAFGGPDRAHVSFTDIQKAINYSMTSFFTTGGIRGGKKKMDKFYPRSFNMGVRREVYETLGGFSRMRFGEDIDFSIRIFKGGRIDRAILYAASVLNESHGTLKGLFRQIVEERTDILFPVKDLEQHHGLGFSAWCDNNRILIGTRRYLEQEGVPLPDEEYEMQHSKNGELQILYLAVSGNLHAMFVLKYVGGRNVARGLAVLQKENIRLLVTCQDPSLTAHHITEAYRLPEGMITVLDQEQCNAIKAAPEDPEDTCCMIHLKAFASLTGGLQAADQAQNAESSATTVQMVSVLFSIIIAALLTSAGSIWELSVATVLMYQAAWSALSIAVCALKQHN